MQLDLLDAGVGRFGGAFVLEFGDAGADAGVGGVDVVEEDLARLVRGGADSVGKSSSAGSVDDLGGVSR